MTWHCTAALCLRPVSLDCWAGPVHVHTAIGTATVTRAAAAVCCCHSALHAYGDRSGEQHTSIDAIAKLRCEPQSAVHTAIQNRCEPRSNQRRPTLMPGTVHSQLAAAWRTAAVEAA